MSFPDWAPKTDILLSLSKIRYYLSRDIKFLTSGEAESSQGRWLSNYEVCELVSLISGVYLCTKQFWRQFRLYGINIRSEKRKIDFGRRAERYFFEPDTLVFAKDFKGFGPPKFERGIANRVPKNFDELEWFTVYLSCVYITKHTKRYIDTKQFLKRIKSLGIPARISIYGKKREKMEIHISDLDKFCEFYKNFNNNKGE